jgi:hypothetical protein
MIRRSVRRAFTLVEVAATLAAAGVIGAVVALSADPPAKDGQDGGGNMAAALAKARQAARQQKDASQLRGIHQGLVMWAQNNDDEFPLPSRVDKRNDTVREEGRAKDTTANIFSLMVANGLLTTEMFISPLEKNRNIRNYRNYQYDSPKAAVNPPKAYWDPAMRAGLTPDSRGHISYAHLQPAGDRMKAWGNTLVGDQFVLSTRGPEISAVDQRPNGSVVPRFANPQSITLQLLGDGEIWSGHIVGNDNHVQLAEDWYGDERLMGRVRPLDYRPRYKSEDAREWPDILFFDERDDPKSANLFLSLFTRAGEAPKDYEAIWD